MPYWSATRNMMRNWFLVLKCNIFNGNEGYFGCLWKYLIMGKKNWSFWGVYLTFFGFREGFSPRDRFHNFFEGPCSTSYEKLVCISLLMIDFNIIFCYFRHLRLVVGSILLPRAPQICTQWPLSRCFRKGWLQP